MPSSAATHLCARTATAPCAGLHLRPAGFRSAFLTRLTGCSTASVMTPTPNLSLQAETYPYANPHRLPFPCALYLVFR